MQYAEQYQGLHGSRSSSSDRRKRAESGEQPKSACSLSLPRPRRASRTRRCQDTPAPGLLGSFQRRQNAVQNLVQTFASLNTGTQDITSQPAELWRTEKLQLEEPLDPPAEFGDKCSQSPGILNTRDGTGATMEPCSTESSQIPKVVISREKTGHRMEHSSGESSQALGLPTTMDEEPCPRESSTIPGIASDTDTHISSSAREDSTDKRLLEAESSCVSLYQEMASLYPDTLQLQPIFCPRKTRSRADFLGGILEMTEYGRTEAGHLPGTLLAAPSGFISLTGLQQVTINHSEHYCQLPTISS